MRTTEFLAQTEREGHSLLAAAENAGWDAEVPTCPGWQVRHLVAHQGSVHRWAARHLTERLTAGLPLADEKVDDVRLAEWYRQGLSRLLDVLAEAPDGADCWTFLAGAQDGRRFWARRQAHETTLHRVDAELAEGISPSPISESFARDGIDELLSGFHTRERSRVRSERPATLRVRTTDGESSRVWTVHLSDRAPRVVEGPAGSTESGEVGADCELSGPAELLYLALWNRLPQPGGLTVRGEEGLLQLWQERSAVA